MPRRDFAGIPNPPDTGNADMNRFLNAIKENLELLCGQRGDDINFSVVKGDITTAYPEANNTLPELTETVRGIMVNMKGEG